MKLTLKNIGKIGDATVIIDGITVIAGENNTGKSTVGKVLFSVFNSFYDVDGQIKYEKIKSIANAVNRFVSYNPARNAYTNIFSNSIAEYIIDHMGLHINDEQAAISIISEAFKQYYKEFDESVETSSISKNLLPQLRRIFDVNDEEVFINIITNRLWEEFNGQLNNINSEDMGEIDLYIKETLTSIKIKEKKLLTLALC